MGEWKAQLSVRVRQKLRREMEEYAHATDVVVIVRDFRRQR